MRSNYDYRENTSWRRTRDTQQEDVDIQKLLSTNEGIAETPKIWKEFEEARKEDRELRGGIGEREKGRTRHVIRLFLSFLLLMFDTRREAEENG